MPKFSLGGFAGGLASGIQTGYGMSLQEKRDAREAEAAAQTKRIREIGIGRMEKEEGTFDKELLYKGAKLDYDNTELGFKAGMRDYEQKTRRLLAEGARTQAQNAATQGEVT